MSTDTNLYNSKNECLEAKLGLEVFLDKHEQLKLKLNSTADQIENILFYLSGETAEKIKKDYNVEIEKILNHMLQYNQDCYDNMEKIQQYAIPNGKDCELMIKNANFIIDHVKETLSCVYQNDDNLSFMIYLNNTYTVYDAW